MHNNLRRYIDPDKQSVIERFPLRGGSLLREVPLQTIRKQLGWGVFEIGYNIHTQSTTHKQKTYNIFGVCVCSLITRNFCRDKQ